MNCPHGVDRSVCTACGTQALSAGLQPEVFEAMQSIGEESMRIVEVLAGHAHDERPKDGAWCSSCGARVLSGRWYFPAAAVHARSVRRMLEQLDHLAEKNPHPPAPHPATNVRPLKRPS